MQDRFLDAVVNPSSETKKVEVQPNQSGSFLDSVVPSKYRQVTSDNLTPDNLTTEESSINVDAYNPTSIMKRIVPKVEDHPKPTTRRVLVKATAKDKFFDSLSSKPKQGPIRNIPEGYVDIKMPEQFISKEAEDSFVTKLVDNVSRLFTSKAEESAKAVYQTITADYLGANPSDISPDLISAFRSGYGKTNLGLISQIERKTKYPSPVAEEMNTKQQLAAGLGGVVGSLPTFIPFSLAGAGGGPIGMMMAGFAGDQGLRAYYSYKLENGEVSSPKEFVDALKKVVPETLKGAVLGTSTGVAGKIAAPLGNIAKVGTEAGVMTTMGAILENTLPTLQDFINNAILFGSIHGISKIPTTLKNIKDVWVKTGRTPKDIVEDTSTDPKLAKALVSEESIPEDVIAEAQAKVDAVEKAQTELATKLEAIKHPIEAETLVKEELNIKGKKVKDIKEGKIEEEIELPPFDSDKEMLKSLGYEEEEIARFSPEEIQKILREDEFIDSLNIPEPTSELTGIKMFITNKEKYSLEALGYSKEEIKKMKPEDAERIIREGKSVESLNELEPAESGEEVINNLKNIKNVKMTKGEPKFGDSETLHGTDINNLEGILANGLKAGSAIGGKDWAAESPVVVSVPTAKKGDYVAHNNYYKIKENAPVDKVTIDLDQYSDTVSEKVIAQVAELAKKYPKVKFTVLNIPEASKPKYTLKDMMDIDNKIVELYKAPNPELDALKTEKAKILEPFKRGESSYNTTGMSRELRGRLDEINAEIKVLERQRQNRINALEEKSRQAAIDVDRVEGTDFSEEAAKVESAGEVKPEAKITNLKPSKIVESDTTVKGEQRLKTDLGKSEEDIKNVFDEFRESVAKKDIAEDQGQHILDRMEEEGRSPADVSKDFWDKTYWNLSAEDQIKFQKLLKNQTGMDVGSVLWTNPKTGESKTAENVIDIAKEFENDIPGSVEYLEGTTRGYVALMEWANNKTSKQPWNATMKSRLETVNQEVAQNRDKIITQSRKQAEYDGWLEKWAPEKAIDDYYREHSGISTSGWKALKKGETWKGRLEKLAEKEKQTKKQPVTDLDLQTGAPLPKALEPSNHPFRDKDAKHTEVMKKLLQEKVSNVDASPEVFTRYLINEVNRWLNGEEVAIDKVRNGLSELAIKVDNLKNKFEFDKDFTLWRDTVKEAARWARDVDRLKNKRTGETKLMMGVDPTQLPEATKKIFKDASRFFEGTSKALKEKSFNTDYAIKQLGEDLNLGLMEQQEHLLKEIRRLYPKESQRIIDRQRSAANGKGYGEIEYNQMVSEVFGGKSDRQVGIINDYLLARRYKDIYGYRSIKDYKSQPEYGPIESASVVATMEMIKDLPEHVFAKLISTSDLKKRFEKASAKDVADAIKSTETFFEWHRKLVDDLVESGLKSEEEGNLLKAHDFRKFKTISVEKLYDFDYQTHLKGETIRSTNSGVQSLGHGSTKIIDPDARVSAHEMFVRAYGSIANQAAKLEWKGLAEKYPDNTIVSLKQISGWSPMPYFEKGVKKELYFSPEASKYMVTRSHDISHRLSTVIRGATFAPFTRTLAVGASPLWSTFIGLPMDIVHTLWTAKTWEADATKVRPKLSFPFYETTKGDYKRVYSPYNPLSPLQLGHDMSRTLGDIYTRGPLFHNLAKHGLAMSFLSMREGRYVKGAKPPGDWAKLLDILSYHGTSMEFWVRAATADRVVRRRANELYISYEESLKNDNIMYEAVHAGRDRMDYNQGGWIIKALDQNGMIFLNAAVLGTRTFWRSAKENPVDFAARSIQLIGLAAGITAMAWSLHEDVMKDIPTEGNEKNIVWPLFSDWINFKDENGDTRYLYAKLRMDPGAAFMYKLSDNLTRTYLYDKGIIKQEPDYRKLTDSLKQLGPVGISLPPSIQMVYDYSTNTSWWKDRQMYTALGGRTFDWPKSKHEGKFDPNVSQLAKDIGAHSGFIDISPKRLQGSASNVIPYNNEFVAMFGGAYNQLFSDVPESDRKRPLIETLARMPGFNRVIGITQPNYSRRQVRDNIKAEEDLKYIVNYEEFDLLATDYAWRSRRKREEVINYISSQKTKKDYESMRDKFKFIEKTKDLEHRNIWLSMWHMSPEVRAREYIQTYDSSTDATKRQLEKELMQIDARFRDKDGKSTSYTSEEFKQAYMRIRREKDNAKISANEK